jgi:hypothetical protein
MPQNRRTFLATLGGATLGLACRGQSFAALARSANKRNRIDRIGIQLYTLRRVAGTDLAGTLAQLAKIGYKEIEFAGYYNHPAAEVRDILKANGLSAPSTHLGINVIEASPAKTFEDARTVVMNGSPCRRCRRGSVRPSTTGSVSPRNSIESPRK